MKFKSLKIRVILLSMITVIGVAGIISCGGNDATNPSSLSQGGGSGGSGSNLPTFTERTNITFITNTGTVTNGTNTSGGNTGVGDLGDNNGDTGNKWNIDQTKGLSFYGASRRGIYLKDASPTPWMNVSYNDTDRLTRMWKWTIDGGIKDGKRRKYIKSRDGDFFFDANYNIRWSKKPDTVLKWFQGGVIAQLREGYGDNEFSSTEEQRGGVRFSGYWTIGGLYTFAMHAREARSLNSDAVNEFFWARTVLAKSDSYGAFGGRMEVLVLHPGYPLDKGTGKYKGLWTGSRPGQGWTGEAWAAQSYASSRPNGYDDGGGNNIYNIKGNTPERYMPNLNVTHQLYHLYFRWVVDEVYDPNNYVEATAR